MVETSPRVGVVMVAFAGFFWSLQGLSIRMIEVASAEQVIFWRSVSQGFVLLTLLVIVNRGRVVDAFRRVGFVALVGGVCHLVASMSFVFAITYTTVATVVFVMAASPLFASVMAWIFMRERVAPRALAAMVIALAGIGVMTIQGFAGGNLLGLLFAFTTTVGFAGIAVVVRWGGGLNMLPATCWGALFTAVVSFGLARGNMSIPLPDLGYSFISGGVLTACGATLFMLGARHVPAGVLAFLTLTEVVLAPIWVWMAFNEVPGVYTLVGGAIVLSAIFGEGIARVRDADPPAAGPVAAAGAVQTGSELTRNSSLAPLAMLVVGALMLLTAISMSFGG